MGMSVDQNSGEGRHREGGPFVGCLATVILIGLPAYLLSVGPFVWLVDHGYMHRYFGAIYAPIGLLVSSFEPAARLFRWYLAFWQ